MSVKRNLSLNPMIFWQLEFWDAATLLGKFSIYCDSGILDIILIIFENKFECETGCCDKEFFMLESKSLRL